MSDMIMQDPENPTLTERTGEELQGCFLKLILTIVGTAFLALIAWTIWTPWGLGAHLWPELPERLTHLSFLDTWGLIICTRSLFGLSGVVTQIRRPKA